MKRDTYILWGLTNEDVAEIRSKYIGKRIKYVYDDTFFMFALVTLCKSEYRKAKRELKKINRKYKRKLMLFTEKEFGVA